MSPPIRRNILEFAIDTVDYDIGAKTPNLGSRAKPTPAPPCSDAASGPFSGQKPLANACASKTVLFGRMRDVKRTYTNKLANGRSAGQSALSLRSLQCPLQEIGGRQKRPI